VKQDIEVHLVYEADAPTDMLLQIEVADLPDQRISDPRLDTTPVAEFARIGAEEGMGERIWIRTEGEFRCTYRVRVEVDRPALDLAALPAVPPHMLAGDKVRYLMPSRYCPSDEFQNFVAAEFGGLSGGAQIAAMRDWIHGAFTYVPGSSNAQTTALDSFVQRQGVCRDFAHVMITLARAAAVPARFASVYAPGVTPPDFHAVAEVFLDDTWHLVDPTGMAGPDSIARIGVGADAAQVAFLSSFGPLRMIEQSVSVTELPG